VNELVRSLLFAGSVIDPRPVRSSPTDPASALVTPSRSAITVQVVLGAPPAASALDSDGVPVTPLVARPKFEVDTPSTGSENTTFHDTGPALTNSDAPARSIESNVGRVRSMLRVCSGATPVLPAASSWVADRVHVPFPDSRELRISSHEPEVQDVVAGSVGAPSINGLIVAESPGAVPHVPPIEVTRDRVAKGNVRTEPFTVVTATSGAVVSEPTDTGLLSALVAVQARYTAVTV